MFTIGDTNIAKSVFEVLANPDKATNSEWDFSIFKTKDGNTINYVGTTSQVLYESSGGYNFDKNLREGNRLIQSSLNYTSLSLMFSSGVGEKQLSKDLVMAQHRITSTVEKFGSDPLPLQLIYIITQPESICHSLIIQQ